MSRFSSSVRNEAELADHLHAARLYLGAEFREIGQRMGLVDERTDNDPVRCRGMPLRDRLGWTAGDGFEMLYCSSAARDARRSLVLVTATEGLPVAGLFRAGAPSGSSTHGGACR